MHACRKVIVAARRSHIAGVLLACQLVFAAPCLGEESARPDFRRGELELSLFSGYGFGFARPGYAGGETDDVDGVPLFPQLGFRPFDPAGGDAWYSGSFEALVEGTLLWSTQPHSGFAGGGGLLLRYDFLAVPHVVPFVELGGGMLHLDFDLDDQDDGFGFTLHGGLGARWFFAPQAALAIAYRWQHLSNGGTHLPNDGVDLSEVLLGVSYFIDP